MTTKRRLHDLQRLVHVADLLYRHKAAEVGRASRHRDDLAASAARAQDWVDENGSDRGAWRERVLARAARMRGDLATANAALEQKIRDAAQALAGAKGLEAKRQSMMAKARAEATANDLADILEVITRDPPASFE